MVKTPKRKVTFLPANSGSCVRCSTVQSVVGVSAEYFMLMRRRRRLVNVQLLIVLNKRTKYKPNTEEYLNFSVQHCL